MLITKYDPFKDFRDFQNKLFAQYAKSEGEESNISTFSPVVNTREDDKAYYVDVDVPGVNKSDINVDVKDGMLIISGERNFKEEVKEEDYYKIETHFGKFSRSFKLPENVDMDAISAKNDNGVLEVSIPKVEEKANTKSIKVD